jgi:hypothetical protein
MLFFNVIAALGFVLSAGVHVASLLGISTPFAFALHGGVLVVWIPAIVTIQRAGFTGFGALKAAFAHCPLWMPVVAGLLFVYAQVTFFFVRLPRGEVLAEDTPPGALRGFSSMWMLFFAVAFGVLYSAWRKRRMAEPTR